MPGPAAAPRFECRRDRCHADGRRGPHAASDAGPPQPRAEGRQMVKAGKVGKRSDGAISATIRAEETKLRPYVTIHVTTTPSNSPLGLYLLETYVGATGLEPV